MTAFVNFGHTKIQNEPPRYLLLMPPPSPFLPSLITQHQPPLIYLEPPSVPQQMPKLLSNDRNYFWPEQHFLVVFIFISHLLAKSRAARMPAPGQTDDSPLSQRLQITLRMREEMGEGVEKGGGWARTHERGL